MGNTYRKIYLHVVFAVKSRTDAIPPVHEEEVHRYIGGIINGNGHQVIKIGGTSNHIHILFNYRNLNQTIPDLIREVKSSSSKLINDRRMIKCRFSWQRGYACMSYSQSHIEPLKKYISTQHEHHHNMSLEDEVRRMLEAYEIEYDDRYIIRED